MKTTKAMNQALRELRGIHIGSWLATDWAIARTGRWCDLSQAIENYAHYLVVDGIDEAEQAILAEGADVSWESYLNNEVDNLSDACDAQGLQDHWAAIEAAGQAYASDIVYLRKLGLSKDEARRLRRQARKAAK